MPRMNPNHRRLIAFVAVGTAAAAVHFGVVVALVSGLISGLELHPLQANVVGWLVAFVVSYGGHRRLTFRASGASTRQSLPRFFAISAGGFVANESAYALLLSHTGMPYRAALGVVLVGLAVITYLASRHWAFRHRPA